MFTQSRLFILSILLLLLFSPQALAKMRLEVDHDETVDFSLFKTYAWTTGTPAPRATTQRRIVEEVDGRLQAGGMVKTEDDPDFLVVTHVSVDQAQLSTDTTFGYGGYVGWTGWSSWGVTTANIKDFTVGSLVIDIIDAGTNTLIWRAAASDTVQRNKPKKSQKTVRKAVKKAFRNFPPK